MKKISMMLAGLMCLTLIPFAAQSKTPKLSCPEGYVRCCLGDVGCQCKTSCDQAPAKSKSNVNKS